MLCFGMHLLIHSNIIKWLMLKEKFKSDDKFAVVLKWMWNYMSIKNLKNIKFYEMCAYC